MSRRSLRRALACLPVVLGLLPGPGRAASGPDNRGVVELETGGSSGISVRMAEELAGLVDDGTTRRVLPVVGKGAQQNLVDLAFLRGLDLAIVPVDVLERARQQRLLGGAEGMFTYVAQLWREEFHLLARPEIRSIGDLANKRVNVDVRGAGTPVTAGRLFELLHVPVVATNDEQALALEKLRRGEIAALAYVAGKPAPLFQGLRREDGLHFLSIPLDPAVIGAYVPTTLSAQDYPNLVAGDQPVDTVSVGMALVVANLQPAAGRYRAVANFTEAFFTGFATLLEPGHHPKWREINLATVLPGWTRFPPAQRWLDRNAAVAARPSQEERRAQFSRFIDTRRQALGGAEMTLQQKQELFDQFEQWLAGQAH